MSEATAWLLKCQVGGSSSLVLHQRPWQIHEAYKLGMTLGAPPVNLSIDRRRLI